jgi:hypothetical protein
MPVYLLTGKLGSGKSLAAVGRAVEYVEQGRRVVANFWLDVGLLARSQASIYARSVVEVLPDRPRAGDLVALGRGGPSEERAGLLILDECATWLNARTWNGKEREAVIDWFLHSRKLGWDVILICQHASALDKQVREMICEYLVTCRRLDRFKVPLFGIQLPRVHVASVRYGLAPTDLNAEHWVYRGGRYFALYATNWISSASTLSGWHRAVPDEDRIAVAPGWKSVMPMWHRMRLKPPLTIRQRIRSHWLGALVLTLLDICQAIPFWFAPWVSSQARRRAGEGGTRRRGMPAGGRAFTPATWQPLPAGSGVDG